MCHASHWICPSSLNKMTRTVQAPPSPSALSLWPISICNQSVWIIVAHVYVETCHMIITSQGGKLYTFHYKWFIKDKTQTRVGKSVKNSGHKHFRMKNVPRLMNHKWWTTPQQKCENKQINNDKWQWQPFKQLEWITNNVKYCVKLKYCDT